MAHDVIIYTDGAAKGNPGRGGYGVVLLSGAHRKELSGGFKQTTNNRMELLAVIVGLEALKFDGCNVTVYSDSLYVVNAIEKKWLFTWERLQFKKKKNPDLWIRFLKAYRKHTVNFIWVKGHDGNSLNERCDRLAVQASEQSKLMDDTYYIKSLALGELDFDE
jgi:ribonuclease HI